MRSEPSFFILILVKADSAGQNSPGDSEIGVKKSLRIGAGGGERANALCASGLENASPLGTL